MADEKDPSELGTVEDPQPTGAPAESAAVSEEDAQELRKKAAEHALAQAEAEESELAGASGAVPEDVLTQEALARRVAALGEHDATEAIAREEEEKLAARRTAARKKGGKSGGKSALETAASKRLGKIGTRAVPKPRDPATSDLDPVLDRTVALRKWVTDNARVVQFGALAVVVALAGGLGWISYQGKREESASAALSAAVADEHGRIGDPDKEDEADAPKDPRPVFKTIDARTDSALAKYRDVEAKYSGTGAAILSRLGEGALLLDKHDADGAIAAFTDVKGSALSKADAEVRGRALEGLGMAYELSGVAEAGRRCGRRRGAGQGAGGVQGAREHRRRARLPRARDVRSSARPRGQGRQGARHRAAQGAPRTDGQAGRGVAVPVPAGGRR